MDSYIQILCRLQKSQRKVPPPSLTLYCLKNHPLCEVHHLCFKVTADTYNQKFGII